MATDRATLWALAQEAVAAAAARAPAGRERPDAGVDHLVFLSLLVLLAAEPVTCSAAQLQHAIAFYTATETFVARLEAGVDAGHLAHAGDGAYRLGDGGRRAVTQALAAGAALWAEVDTLTGDEGLELAALYRPVADAGIALLTSDGWFSESLHRLIPAEGPPLACTMRCHICVSTFRADVHRAAWPPGLTPPSMTVLTHLSTAGTATRQSVLDGLARRGYPAHTRTEALGLLESRGLLDAGGDEINLSPSGRELREGVEDETDARFFAAWSCLDDGSRDRMAQLLRRLAGDDRAT